MLFSSRAEPSCGTIYSKKFSFLSPTYTLARGVEMCFAVHIYLLKSTHRVIIGGRFFVPYKIRLFSRGRVNSCTIRSFHDSFFFSHHWRVEMALGYPQRPEQNARSLSSFPTPPHIFTVYSVSLNPNSRHARPFARFTVDSLTS